MKTRTKLKVLERDNYTCQYCGRSAPGVILHVDHIIPRSIGGKDVVDNLQVLCSECNLSKSDGIFGISDKKTRLFLELVREIKKDLKEEIITALKNSKELNVLKLTNEKVIYASESTPKDARLFSEAKEIVTKEGRGSASLLQRKLSIGYARAARIIDQLEAAGVVAHSNGTSKPRDVIGRKGITEQSDSITMDSHEENNGKERDYLKDDLGIDVLTLYAKTNRD